MPDQLGARLSGRCLVGSSRISISVMIQSEASRPLERNPCCPAARPWILINVLLTCDEAIQPVFRFHLASEIIIFVRPQAPHWRTLFLGQMGKLSTRMYKRVACRHIAYFEISLWEVIHQPIQSSWLYKRRFYDDFRFNAIMSQQLHRHQRSSGQLRAHSRELWAKTHKSACRLIDLL